MNDLVSVIIPAYNVEKWIEKCIQSVCCQTYENLEIILVNDGSLDNTKDICIRYSQLDSRIILINQENQGLSAARNAGLKIARGKYVMFVDGDDFLDEKIVQVAHENIADADICIFQFAFVDENGNKNTNGGKLNEKIILYGEESFIKILTDDRIGGIAACWKLYRKSLFVDNKVYFPVGKYHEDCFTTYKLFFYAKKIVYIPDEGYYYLQRENSIVHSNFEIKHMDKIDAADECLGFIKKNSINNIMVAESAAIRWYLQVANKIIRDGKKHKEYLDDIKKKLRCIDYKRNNYLSLKYKFLCSIYVKNVWVYSLILMLFKANN